MKDLTLIVAMTPSGLIGLDGKIPWQIPEDLKRFKQLTTGHAIIMGRKTFESIGRPLPNRTNIVVTRKGVKVPGDMKPGTGFVVCTSIHDALTTAYERVGDASPFVIGGGEIYDATIGFATRLEVTFVVRREIERAARDAAQEAATRFVFSGAAPFTSTYPSGWDWRCTGISSPSGLSDVEFHSFERRTMQQATSRGASSPGS
jgi:dihydrofolate reductase